MRGWLRQRNVETADLYCVVLIVAVLTAAFSPVLASLDKFPRTPKGNDWYKYCMLNRPPREAILRDHEFALRTQYLGGGYPLVGYPEGSALSPMFVTILLLGENAGLKLQLLIKLLVGGLGMYYLLRAGLGCPPAGGAIGALVLGLSNWFHGKIGVGYIDYTSYFFFPLIMALFLDAVRGRRSIGLASLVLALVLIDGKYVGPVSLLFLCLWGVPEVVRFRRGAIVFRFGFFTTLAMVVGLGCLLAMVKILPMVEIVGANPRSLYYDALAMRWDTASEAVHASFYDLPALGRSLVTPGGLRDQHIGLGWAPLCLGLVAVVVHPRALARWAVLLVAFAWLSLGYRAPLDLWWLVWHLPVFGSMDKPAISTNFFILLPVCVLAASVFRGSPRTMAGRYGYAAYLCAGAIAVAVLLQQAYRTNIGHFTQPLQVESQATQATLFFQVKGGDNHETYCNMLRNVGTIDWDGDLLLPEYAIPAWFVGEDGPRRNEEYLGRAWIVGGRGSGVLAMRCTANAIDLEVRCAELATVVINQNFHPGWHSSVGEVRSQHGLLAVADVPPGNPQAVRLRYSSRSFLIGLAVSAVSLGVLVWVGLRQMRRGRRAAERARREVTTEGTGGEIQVVFGAWSVRKRVWAVIGLGVACAAVGALTVPTLRVDYALRSASVLSGRGDRTRAIELCRSVLGGRPHHRLAKEILGKCYYHDGRLQEAIDELKTAVQLGTREPHTYLLLARSYWQLGQFREAKRVYEELFIACPISAHRMDEEYRAFCEDLEQAKLSQEAGRVRGGDPR